MLTTDPMQAPDTPEDITIGFDRGRPVTVNGRALGALELLTLPERHRVGGTESDGSIWSRTG
jgi:argininosuccinate synthase